MFCEFSSSVLIINFYHLILIGCRNRSKTIYICMFSFHSSGTYFGSRKMILLFANDIILNLIIHLTPSCGPIGFSIIKWQFITVITFWKKRTLIFIYMISHRIWGTGLDIKAVLLALGFTILSRCAAFKLSFTLATGRHIFLFAVNSGIPKTPACVPILLL